MNIFIYPYKSLKLAHLKLATSWWTLHTRIVLFLNGATFGRIKAIGRPRINVSLGGKLEIGDGFYIRTGLFYTEVGSVGSRILVGPKGRLKIGDNVGMSNCTLVADESVMIGDDVMIGGGTQVFDTNFHSTDAAIRTSGRATRDDVKRAAVEIGNNVFIGANCLICKGVSIGDGAMVAAGSVVVRDVPAGEAHGGNPARKIS